MKLKRPGDNLFNARNLLPIPFFLIMLVILGDVLFQYFGGGAVPGWKVGVLVVLVLYVGGRAWYGVRQAIDFER